MDITLISLSFLVCLLADNLTKYKKKFDNEFELESKYHRKTVVLLLIAHILSLQDVVCRSMLFSYSQLAELSEFGY